MNLTNKTRKFPQTQYAKPRQIENSVHFLGINAQRKLGK